MNATISVGGKWRAFRLAEQLERRGDLRAIVTSYPRYVLRSERVSPDRIVTLPLPEALARGIGRVPALADRIPGGYIKAALFDRLASAYVTGSDLFVGWAGYAACSLKVARAMGVVGCIERESSHIAYSERLLRREHEAFGVRYRGTDPRSVDRHLLEYELADYIVVPSTFAYDSFVAEGIDRRKLVLLPSGVDVERFRPAPKRDDVFRAVFVGALSLRKGVHYLLEAASRLRLPNFELVLIGGITPAIRPFLERYAGAYRYGGTCPNPELAERYAQGSVFVLPSIEEGMAYVLGEAMACGLPIVASTHTGAADMITDGVEGFLVPPRDVDALADRLQRLYDDPGTLENMARAARARVERMTWDHYGERAAATYHALLDHAP